MQCSLILTVLFLEMYSLLQLSKLYLSDDVDDDIPLSATTPEGVTTLNNLEVHVNN